VQRISGLESNNVFPTRIIDVLADLLGSAAKVEVIVVRGGLDTTKFTADVGVASVGVQKVNCGVFRVSAEYKFGFLGLIRFPHVSDVQDGDDVALVVFQGNAGLSARFDSNFLGFSDIQGNGDGEKGAISKPLSLDTAVVILLGHEGVEGRKTSIENKLNIAELATSQGQLGIYERFSFASKHFLLGFGEDADELSSGAMCGTMN
jgi:hypothetical protein